jgi:hypothetical protein
MPPGDSVLVSVQRGDDAAAVIADSDGRLWIAHGHARAAQPITLLDGLQPGQVDGDGWTAVGGALPPDAQSAGTRK